LTKSLSLLDSLKMVILAPWSIQVAIWPFVALADGGLKMVIRHAMAYWCDSHH
jgi:hypothetical protein